jgi:AP-2 complex subunit alpha
MSLIPYAVHILGMLVLKRTCAREYLYTDALVLVADQAAQLQLYPHALQGAERDRPKLTCQWRRLLQLTVSFQDFDRARIGLDQQVNADHAVLFESVNLIVCWGSSGPAQLRDGTMVAGKFISVRELTFDTLVC